MDQNFERAAYAVGGFLLPGAIATTVMVSAPETSAEFRRKLGTIGLVSTVAGVLAAMMRDERAAIMGASTAMGGALITVAAMRIPNTSDKPALAGGFDPLIASMHLGTSVLKKG
jgi:hypothetical protein